MKKKELKKLKRTELLEVMITQSKEIDRLREELRKTQDALNERNLRLQNCGSIAEAAMEIYEVVERTQKAAELYLENVKRKAESEE